MTELHIGPWRRGLDGIDVTAVRGLLARTRASDRRGPGPDDAPGPGADVAPAVLDGELAGIAWRSGGDPAELVVDPRHRRRGIGTRLARAALGPSGMWAHGTLPAAVALAGSVGALPVRRLLQLRRDLVGPFPVRLPPGVAIRTFRRGEDEDRFLAVNARAFSWHPEQGRLGRAGLAAAMAQGWFDAAGFFLAVRDGGDGDGATVLGFHWTKVHPHDPTPPAGQPGPIGEVYVLGVDPDSPIRGLGTPLTMAGLAHLADRGLRTVMLYVESDNEPALHLYRRLGFADYTVDTVFATR